MSLYTSKYTGPQIDAMIANGGSPSGTYASLAALTTAIPEGNAKIYVTLDDGKWCNWSGTAWEAGGTYIGTAATFAVGTVTKGDNAVVTNSGTNNEIVLDFVLPKGDKGEDGKIGVDGAPGPQGPQGIQGPKGDKGDAAATVSVGTTTTGAAGSSASVTNSGTSSDAVFNFTIPQGATGATGAKGDKGDKGDTGDQGLQGVQGVQGVKGDTGNDGRGITSIVRTSGTGAAGTTDTYTITFTDSTTATFSVYNGADGTGSGDMTKAVYDTNNNGIVDNSEKVGGHTVAVDVPSGAKFTDTVTEISSTATDIKMNGTQAAGTTGKAADAGHVHPVDTSRAAASHAHVKADITDFPSTMAPTAHKSTHATGGADALTAGDIGAAAVSHTHAVGDLPAQTSITNSASSIPSSSAVVALVGRSTAVTAADTGYASFMARGEALVSADTTPSYNGQICWKYS